MKVALSGRELSIGEELIGCATRLERMPGFYPDRICFLVNEEEWNELDNEMRSLARYVSDETMVGTKKMFIKRIEVRKR
jgi:hypothetical protein